MKKLSLISWLVFLILVAVSLLGAYSTIARAQQVQAIFLPLVLGAPATPTPAPIINGRSVNVPYFPNNDYRYSSSAVFWFGKVNSTDVYADVRVGYNDSEIIFSVNLIDRYLWYDVSPNSSDLANWDAVSLYVSTSETPGSAPGPQDTRWLTQLANASDRLPYQAALRGNGTAWVPTALPFSTTIRFQGGINGNGDGKGWSLTYHIPMSSLGYTTPPPQGTLWHLGVVLHDRDSSAGPPRADTVWPEGMTSLNPASWGGLRLGLLPLPPSTTDYDGVTIIRNGLQGAVVEDAHVGGAFDCGESVGWDFDRWGNINYESVDETQINIQNQWKIDDWPCFSKYYTTYPLNLIPSDAEVVSATLTMYHFGNSNPADAPGSIIQVFIVSEAWDDTTITWNNAPLAWTNISRLWVEPLQTYPGWPGVPHTWNVSLAIQEALNVGGPLRLAFYSSDYGSANEGQESGQDTGKYFHSSDVGEGNPSARPYLTVWWRR